MYDQVRRVRDKRKLTLCKAARFVCSRSEGEIKTHLLLPNFRNVNGANGANHGTGPEPGSGRSRLQNPRTRVQVHHPSHYHQHHLEALHTSHELPRNRQQKICA
ncbi:uncharacterized protein BO66DRAFT_124771 [Aspergillus aculeatinus CBS 121060]|uniref:Uncharacterized protein n=1 Tax=Aspergillus aculeatinus CBS 121060 TaxID=1448322 RepID=A0ACD1H4Y7_9EURO|nr:hypothetical protein BO66DRAFT_124771 [Aspergillus aculeatinus CBS 121060]RAH68686.1 hypothetical protein BO66DRAFT_124771 [Aspergillus aculeatinus CBS 121060]